MRLRFPGMFEVRPEVLTTMDPATFRQIVATHREAVFSTIGRITGQSVAVEDLALDVFAAAHRVRDRVDDWNLQLTRLAVDRSLRYVRSSAPSNDRLAVLSAEQRVAFVLHYAEGRSSEEVCAIRGISPRELRRTLEKAHQRLSASEKQSSPWMFLKLALGWRR